MSAATLFRNLSRRALLRRICPGEPALGGLDVPLWGQGRLHMTNDPTHAGPQARGLELDIDAALDGCGPSFDEIRECVLACRRLARRALDARLQRALLGRGIEVERACATELAGSLGDVSMCELLQVISLGRKDAVIDVLQGELTSRVWCSGGKVVDAVSGRLKGEAAAYRIAALGQGEVVVDFRPVRRSRAVAVSTQALVMEALRRKDECALLESRLGGLECSYRSAPGVAPRDELRGLESALLDALEAGARVGSVLACSSVDDLTVLQAMARLAERGWLVPAHDASRSASVPKDRPLDVAVANSASGARRPLRTRTVAWLAGAAVSVLGAGLAATCSQSRTVPAPQAEASPSSAAAPSAAGEAPPPSAAPAVPRASADPSPGHRAVVPPHTLHTYPMRLVVDPSSAEIWLDGLRIATGELSMVLPRDGRAHELRITAPCHVAQTLIFRDVPPPSAVVLARGAPATGAGS
jgi:hypothetical protein